MHMPSRYQAITTTFNRGRSSVNDKSNKKKTALQNYNIRSCKLFFFRKVWWWKHEIKIHTGTRSNRRPKMAKKSRVMTTWPVLRHWCQASRIRGCKMVLDPTRRNRFTTAGRVRTDSGWSWTFWIARVTLHEGEVALPTLQTLARAIFSLSVWPTFVRISTSGLHHRTISFYNTEKNLSDKSSWFWSAVFL